MAAGGDEPRWLWLELVEDIHEHSLEEWDGLAGVREPSQLDASRERPRTRFAYGGESRIPALAAWYVIAFARTQCFVDGNKRTALLCALTFLDLNGYEAEPDRDEIWQSVVAVAEGAISEDDFVEWMVSISRPR